MKRIQRFYLYSYRMIGFIFLVGLISSILWYGFTLLFYMGSSSWAVPTILSPNQERVINHLEHVLVLEDHLTKDIAELKTIKQSLSHKKTLLNIANELQLRVQKTLVSQSKQYEKNSRIFKELGKEKKATVSELMLLASKIEGREATIDKELKVGLITKEEALAAHLVSNKIRSELVDAKAHMQDLRQRSLDFSNAANTLNGSADNMVAMYKVVKKIELENQIAQLKSDIFSLDITVEQLRKNISKKTKAIHLIKKSPYIRAIKKLTTVAFVPYLNLKHVSAGSPIYSCYLDMIFCYQSGQVTHVYKAEEYFPHPIFKSEIKGQLIGIKFNHQSFQMCHIQFLLPKAWTVLGFYT